MHLWCSRQHHPDSLLLLLSWGVGKRATDDDSLEMEALPWRIYLQLHLRFHTFQGPAHPELDTTSDIQTPQNPGLEGEGPDSVLLPSSSENDKTRGDGAVY